jgi:hypothetical protein
VGLSSRKSLQKYKYKCKYEARHQWLTHITLPTQEAEIGGSRFKASMGKLLVRPYLKKNQSQKRVGGVAQGVGPELKPSTTQKNLSMNFIYHKKIRTNFKF